MFTGIVSGLYPIKAVEWHDGIVSFSVTLDDELVEGLVIGASVAVDGVCLTVIEIDGHVVSFDAVNETLLRTTLKALEVGRLVNIERAARFGDEIGGHILSGHVLGTASIASVEEHGENRVITFDVPGDWMKYILTKGYVALDGASLTVVDAHPNGSFSVTLIPETIRKTTFGYKRNSDLVNLEIDPHTQLIVETVEHVLMVKSLEKQAAG